MKAMVVVISLCSMSLLTWWGLTSAGSAEDAATVETYQASSRGFKVTLREKGELQAASSINVQCELEGRSTIISLVEEGKRVEKGDLLVELASDEIAERLQTQRIDVTSADAVLDSARVQLDILLDQNESNKNKAALKLEFAELDLKKYREGDWPKQLQDHRMNLEEASVILDRDTRQLQNDQVLLDKEYITLTEFKNSKLKAMQAQMNFQKAERDLEMLLEITHIKDEKQLVANVEEATSELDRIIKEAAAKEKEQRTRVEAKEKELDLKRQRLQKYERQMDKSRILAPAAGMVVHGASDNRRRWGGDDQIKEGAQVRERQTILELPDTSTMKVVVRIHEAQTDRISVGLPAKIEVEGVKHRVFTGSISRIAPLADSQNRWLNPELKEYETEITLDESDPLLKPGATAHVEILIGELDDVLAVPIQSVYRRGDRSFVFVGKDSTRAEPVEVGVGMASEQFVEITQGLQAGQQVLLAVSDDLKRELPQVSIERFGADQEVAAQAEPGKKTALQSPAKPKGGRPASGKAGGRSRGGQPKSG